MFVQAFARAVALAHIERVPSEPASVAAEEQPSLHHADLLDLVLA
jgi:hypothetical protein